MHDINGNVMHLRSLISSWLGISHEVTKVIIIIPCDSIDTWVAVSYGDLLESCETHSNPWDTIIARKPYYHGIYIQGGRKRVPTYSMLADNVCTNWGTVKEHCSQAMIFESDCQNPFQCDKQGNHERLNHPYAPQ
jgi:hypothetical protein